MSSLAFACALVCLVASIALSTGTSATAGPAPDNLHGCSVGALRGLYVFAWDGYADLGGNLVPKAVMEGKRFNGDGTTFNEFGTVNIGDTTIIDTTGGGGIYTVAADCTGTLSVPNGPSFGFYVGPGAQQIRFNQTAGGIGSGTATRLRW
ncbi:MAG: hypothetical protein ACRD5Z_18565 [Bryobacteraceae bacterium]